MKALILAAGLGTRLRPITDKVPKCMVPVNGITIIQKQIGNLLNNGINDIYVVVGYKSDILKTHIESLGYGSCVKVIQNIDYKTTNNMYSLFLGEKYLNNESFILMNADVFFNEDIINSLLNCNKGNLVVCERGKYLDESMKITLCDNKITSISKKNSKELSYGTSIDVYKISDDASIQLFKIIKYYLFELKDINSWSEVALNDLFKIREFYPLEINSSWVEIDNHEDLALAETLF